MGLELSSEFIGGFVGIESPQGGAIGFVEAGEERLYRLPLGDGLLNPGIVYVDPGVFRPPINQDIRRTLFPVGPQGIQVFPFRAGVVAPAVVGPMVLGIERRPDPGPQDHHHQIACAGGGQIAGDRGLRARGGEQGRLRARSIPGDLLEIDPFSQQGIVRDVFDNLPGQLAFMGYIAGGGQEYLEGQGRGRVWGFGFEGQTLLDGADNLIDSSVMLAAKTVPGSMQEGGNGVCRIALVRILHEQLEEFEQEEFSRPGPLDLSRKLRIPFQGNLDEGAALRLGPYQGRDNIDEGMQGRDIDGSHGILYYETTAWICRSG